MNRDAPVLFNVISLRYSVQLKPTGAFVLFFSKKQIVFILNISLYVSLLIFRPNVLQTEGCR